MTKWTNQRSSSFSSTLQSSSSVNTAKNATSIAGKLHKNCRIEKKSDLELQTVASLRSADVSIMDAVSINKYLRGGAPGNDASVGIVPPSPRSQSTFALTSVTVASEVGSAIAAAISDAWKKLRVRVERYSDTSEGARHQTVGPKFVETSEKRQSNASTAEKAPP